MTERPSSRVGACRHEERIVSCTPLYYIQKGLSTAPLCIIIIVVEKMQDEEVDCYEAEFYWGRP